MKTRIGLNRLGTAVFSATLFGTFSAPAVFAQEDADSAPGVLEEVTVTARKRVENLQELALSVSALGQEEIQLNYANDIRNLVYISPNTVLDDTNQGPGGVAAAYIRGIGVSEVEKNFDPAVGVVVDGIFRGTMTGSLVRAVDLERMEVLRGPQGTLFGRNTIGGVINIVRSKPTMEFGGEVRGSYGDYDTSKLDAIVNLGNGETFGVKLSGSYHNQDEGYFTNVVTGRHDGQYEYKSAGVNALFAPNDDLEIEFTYQADRTDQDSNQLLNIGQPGQVFCDFYGWCSPNLDVPITGDRYLVAQAYDNYSWPFAVPDPMFDHNGLSPYDSTYDEDTIQVEVRWDINENYRLDYIGGSWETEETVITDWDATPDLLFHTDRPAEYEQTTHELRLTYDAGEKLSYTVGAYTWDSEYEIRLLSWIAFVVPGVVFEVPQTTNQDSESQAFFFEGDYDFNDQWTLTLGGRWTEDEKTSVQAGNVNATASAEWDEFTPKAALSYNIDDASMLYALYSRGYRAGGFNGRVDSVETAVTPYNPEIVDNYELGYRSEWLNRSVIFNATLFYMDYQDKQEEIQQPSQTSGTGQVTRVVNAATATIQGAEFELNWQATENLNLRANLGILDAEYDDFTVNTGTQQNPVFTDFSVLDIRRAPDVTGSLSGEYEWQVGPGMAIIHAGARYLGEHEVDFANKPEAHNDSQVLLDASISYYYQDWYFSLFGRNLADEDGYQIGFDVAGLWTYASPRPPRTWGVEVGYTW